MTGIRGTLQLKWNSSSGSPTRSDIFLLKKYWANHIM